MPAKRIEFVVSNRIYPRRAMEIASKAFKDFVEVVPLRPLSGSVKYEFKFRPGVPAEETISEFFNYALALAKKKI